MHARYLICITVALSLTAGQAHGQSAGATPGGYNPGMGGYHSSTGIAIGAAVAAGVGIAYLVLHNRATGKVVGCVESSGSTMLLSDDKNSTYTLIKTDSVTLKTGERVALKGKTIRQSSGELAFEVRGLAKDYGACER
jgi:hypothetical protein